MSCAPTVNTRNQSAHFGQRPTKNSVSALLPSGKDNWRHYEEEKHT